MKKRYIIVPLCIVVIFSLLMLPCSALISDIEDTLVLDRVFYNSNSSSSNLKELVSMTLSQGLSDQGNKAMHVTTKTPNYYVEQFQIYSSSGMPIMDKGTYEFSLQGLINCLEIDDGTEFSGTHYVQSLRQRSVKVYYTDGSSTTYSPDGFSAFTFYPAADGYKYSFSFTLNTTKQVKQINIRLFYSLENFGLPYLDGSEDLWDWIYILGSEDFKITRDETFLTANNGQVNDAHNMEQDLLGSTSGGFNDFKLMVSKVQNIFRPNGANVNASHGVYKGAAFIGQLMASALVSIPALDDILIISLAIGVFTIILGIIAESFGRQNRYNNRAKSNAKARDNLKKKKSK